LGFIGDPPILKEIQQLEYECIDDIEIMDKGNIMTLTYGEESECKPTQYDVPGKARTKKFLYVLWW
jgi:hypothetical protein